MRTLPVHVRLLSVDSDSTPWGADVDTRWSALGCSCLKLARDSWIDHLLLLRVRGVPSKCVDEHGGNTRIRIICASILHAQKMKWRLSQFVQNNKLLISTIYM